MGTGYSRISSGLITSGHTVVAADLEGEFAAIATAFGGSGHTHDGTSSQGSLINLSTSTTGTLGPATGGTGVANNSANTLTYTGNYSLGLTLTGNTSLTIPTSGTLVNSAVTTLSSLTSVGTIGTGVWNGTGIGATYGGTGSAFTQFSGAATTIKTYTLPNVTCNILTDNARVTPAQGGTGVANNSANTIVFVGAYSLTLGLSGATSISLPTTGTLLSTTTGGTLSKGFATTPYSAGTKSSGTFTPDESNNGFQYATNGGAHTLAPPANNTSIVLDYTNNGSAGTITTSGFTKVTGDSFDTTNGHIFRCFISKNNGGSLLNVVAMQ